MNIRPQRTQLIDFTKDSSKITVEQFHAAHATFAKADTEENFKNNLKTQPDDWYYRTHSVNYTINEQGYRCQPFDQIKWDKSIVIFGCSNVYGDAVDDSDTLSARLQELILCPVINLGSPGSSQLTSLYNMMILKNNNIKPRAVIHVWTESMRHFYLDKDFRQCYCGINNNWGLAPNTSTDIFTESKTHIVSAMFNRMVANNVYHDIPVIHATQFGAMCDEQNAMYPNLHLLKFPHIDQGRDLLHPGIEANKNSAKILYEELLHLLSN